MNYDRISCRLLFNVIICAMVIEFVRIYQLGLILAYILIY